MAEQTVREMQPGERKREKPAPAKSYMFMMALAAVMAKLYNPPQINDEGCATVRWRKSPGKKTRTSRPKRKLHRQKR